MSNTTLQIEQNTAIAGLTAEIIATYVANNAIPANDLPRLISEVHATLSALDQTPDEKEAEPLKPAVPIKKSVTRDHIICLEDGLKYKSLKRHLRTSHNMSPEEYRSKWGLPADYPMVAPSYSEQRSKLAKDAGLGRKG